jgi:protein-disulfide isomerase
MKNIPLLLGTILGSVLLIVGIAYYFSGDQVTQESLVVPAEFVAGDARLAKGASESAQVQIVEFSDFECPACKATQPTLNAVMQQFGEEVQLIYRHFPLDTIHPNARDAAYASEVAAMSGKFWEMHDLLFANQEEWSEITNRDELHQKFSEYAEQLQIDKNEFLATIKDNQQVKDLVQADSQAAMDINVAATPTFFVNGQQTAAPQLIQAVNAALQSGSVQPEQQ